MEAAPSALQEQERARACRSVQNTPQNTPQPCAAGPAHGRDSARDRGFAACRAQRCAAVPSLFRPSAARRALAARGSVSCAMPTSGEPPLCVSSPTLIVAGVRRPVCRLTVHARREVMRPRASGASPDASRIRLAGAAGAAGAADAGRHPHETRHRDAACGSDRERGSALGMREIASPRCICWIAGARLGVVTRT